MTAVSRQVAQVIHEISARGTTTECHENRQRSREEHRLEKEMHGAEGNEREKILKPMLRPQGSQILGSTRIASHNVTVEFRTFHHSAPQAEARIDRSPDHPRSALWVDSDTHQRFPGSNRTSQLS
jgi:hypothetical protein